MAPTPPPMRKREPTAADAPCLQRIEALCHQWDRDPAIFTTRYLNLTAASEFYRDHPEKAAQFLAERYLCANPIDGRTKESAEVAPDANEIDPALPLAQALRAALVQPSSRKVEAPPLAQALPPENVCATVQPPRKEEATITLPACDFRQLQAAFIGARAAQRMTKTDMAGLLGVNQSTISRAESPSQNPWPSFFESLKTIHTYAGDDQSLARTLEQKVHACFYPEGIKTVAELVRCIMHRSNGSVEALGYDLGIKALQAKLDPNRQDKLSASDRIQLRNYLADQLPALSHLGITSKHLDVLLPDLLRANNGQTFAEALTAWAELAAGHKEGFVAEVANQQGRSFASNAAYGWGNGTGLAGNLEAIIAVLKTNPNTKDLFPSYEESFRELAATVMKKPRHAGTAASAESTSPHAARIEQQREAGAELRR